MVPAIGSQISESSSMGAYVGGLPGRLPWPPGVNTIAASESVALTPRTTYASTPSATRNPQRSSACSSESPAHMSKNSWLVVQMSTPGGKLNADMSVTWGTR